MVVFSKRLEYRPNNSLSTPTMSHRLTRQPTTKAGQNLLPTGALDPSFCMFRHITRTARAVSGIYDVALTHAGMSGHQFNMLMTLHRVGPCTVGRIASIVGMDPTSVPRAVGPLVERSWLSVKPGKDRREKIITITALGRKRLMKAVPVWERVQKSMLDELGVKNWEQLMTELSELRQCAAKRAGRG